MLLLRSLGRFLSPYSKICVRAPFELLTYPCGRNRAKNPDPQKQAVELINSTLNSYYVELIN